MPIKSAGHCDLTCVPAIMTAHHTDNLRDGRKNKAGGNITTSLQK